MLNFKTKLKKLNSSSEAKTLIANFAWLSALQFASYFFPLLTMPYLARVIGVEGFGKIAFAYAIMVWVQTIADWGFNYTATRDVAQNRDNPQKVSEIFSNVLWARCLLMLISFVVLIILIILIPQFNDNANIILVSFLMIPGYIFFPSWFFQAVERMKYTTILNVIIKLFFTICIFIFIKDKNDYIIQPILISLGNIFVGIFAFYIIIVKWKIKLRKPYLKEIFKAIRASFDIFINNLMPNLYNSLSVVILGIWGGSSATGLLDAGGKFVNAAIQLLRTISRVFFPFLSRRLDRHKTYTSINITIGVFLFSIIFFSAPFIIKYFFTSEFSGSTIILQIMSFSILFLAIDNIYGTNYLIITHNDKMLRNAVTLASIIGFCISLPLIYFFNAIGAALTITFTRGLLALFSYIQASKIMHQTYKIK